MLEFNTKRFRTTFNSYLCRLPEKQKLVWGFAAICLCTAAQATDLQMQKVFDPDEIHYLCGQLDLEWTPTDANIVALSEEEILAGGEDPDMFLVDRRYSYFETPFRGQNKNFYISGFVDGCVIGTSGERISTWNYQHYSFFFFEGDGGGEDWYKLRRQLHEELGSAEWAGKDILVVTVAFVKENGYGLYKKLLLVDGVYYGGTYVGLGETKSLPQGGNGLMKLIKH